MRARVVLFSLIVLSLFASAADAQIGIEEAFPNLPWGFAFPLDLKDPLDGTDRLFVAEKKGKIFTFANDPAASVIHEFIDVTNKVRLGPGEGFYSFAFHPDYENNGYFYTIYAIDAPLRTRLARYTVSPFDSNAADTLSELVIFDLPKDNTLHFGSTLMFGADDYLYISLGDDGVGDNSQDLTNFHGSILRIDVDNPSGGNNYGIPVDNPFVGNPNGFKEEIWAFGLRNPWRFTFDPFDDSMWLGDVGLNDAEEIDIILKGRNYGWPLLEGLQCYVPNPCDTDTVGLDLVDPIWVYDPPIAQAVAGGHVYRGTRHPGLVGKYIYTDFQVGKIWGLYYDGIAPTLNQILYNGSNFGFVATVGIDKDNELYFPSFQDGRIYRMTGDFAWPAPTGIGTQSPHAAELRQNYPNPFNPQTTIEYAVLEAARVELGVYDVTGRRVRTLVDARREPGLYAVQWDATTDVGRVAASGIYFYRLFADGAAMQTHRMLLLK